MRDNIKTKNLDSFNDALGITDERQEELSDLTIDDLGITDERQEELSDLTIDDLMSSNTSSEFLAKIWNNRNISNEEVIFIIYKYGSMNEAEKQKHIMYAGKIH